MNSDQPADRMSEEAALWVAKLEYGLAAEEQDQFLEWLTADSRHGAELARQKSNWNRLNLLADWRPEHGERPNRDLLAPAPAKPKARSKAGVHWIVGSSFAAAAAVAIILFLAPGNAVDSAQTTPGRISAIEQRTLPDGSLIVLNRGTVLSALYSTSERRVRLERGEASFQVAKNHERPFIVTAGGVDVVAVGTAFNVRLAPSSVEVLVTEGRVQVQPPEGVSGTGVSVRPSATFVAAGECARVPLAEAAPAPQVASVTPTQVNQLLAWQPKWLDFTETPLESVVEEFNRRNAPIRIVIADGALSDTVVSASLRSDNIENFLRLLEGTFGVKAVREGNTIILHKAQRD